MDNRKAGKKSYAFAIREALQQTMENDASVILIGEGVPDPKAIFGTTEGLRERFGASRVFDMPLSENGMTGICIGAALSGLRPVMVHQRIDFALLAMDQLVNNAAKWNFMFNGKADVPIVIRVIIGRGWGQGPQHSQSLQALFAHIPGLRVVMPTTAYDAKGMLVSAIEGDAPVIFIEHRWLHYVEDDVPDKMFRVALDKARVLHAGDAVTIAAFSYMALEAYAAARALCSEMGVNVEVLDMRSVRPLDIDSVMASVRKTRRLIVADTASKTGCVAGEIVAQVVECENISLESAPVRIASPDYPLGTSPFLSDGYYPDARTIADAVVDMLGIERDNEQYRHLCSSLKREGPHDTPNQAFSGPF